MSEKLTVEEIKSSEAILREILQGYGLSINRNGWISCPFHSDQTPSMHIWKKSGRVGLHCFGCNYSGSVLDLIMKMEGCGFKEALEKLGGECGKRSVKSILHQYHRQSQADAKEEEGKRLRKRIEKIEAKIRFLEELKVKFGPSSPEEEFSAAFEAFCNRQVLAERDLECAYDELDAFLKRRKCEDEY